MHRVMQEEKPMFSSLIPSTPAGLLRMVKILIPVVLVTACLAFVFGYQLLSQPHLQPLMQSMPTTTKTEPTMPKGTMHFRIDPLTVDLSQPFVIYGTKIVTRDRFGENTYFDTTMGFQVALVDGPVDIWVYQGPAIRQFPDPLHFQQAVCGGAESLTSFYSARRV